VKNRLDNNSGTHPFVLWIVQRAQGGFCRISHAGYFNLKVSALDEFSRHALFVLYLAQAYRPAKRMAVSSGPDISHSLSIPDYRFAAMQQRLWIFQQELH
jgi:hypothetical protein